MAAAIERVRGKTTVGALLMAALLTFATGPARADADIVRGKALYENHCGSCHGCKAHTRREPAVRNLSQLATEVDRWQTQQKLGWNPEDQAAVVEYLNRTYYRF
jgi:mono/diheme cytochrome c family protein